MRFGTKRINYGILVALELAMQPSQEPIQARVIAKRQGMPLRVLEHVLTSLKRAGLIESTRGAHGGYRLRKSPAELSLAQIVEALDGPIVVPVTVSRSPSETRRDSQQQVLLSTVWDRVRQAEMDLLNRLTLMDLVSEFQTLHQRSSPMYHI